MKPDDPDIVIEVVAGEIHAIHSSSPLRIRVLNWDAIPESKRARFVQRFLAGEQANVPGDWNRFILELITRIEDNDAALPPSS